MLPHHNGHAMELGRSKCELDTPALCVDLDAMEDNIR